MFKLTTFLINVSKLLGMDILSLLCLYHPSLLIRFGQHLAMTELDVAMFLVESLIRVMYWVVAAILNRPFKPFNIKFCIIFVHILVH